MSRIRRANQDPRLQFPLIGKIKCGKKGANGYPMSTDYFIPSSIYAKHFTDVYGEKPSTLQVVFMENDPSLVCNERLELRDSAGALVAHGDGVDFMVYDPKSESYKPYSVEDHPELPEKLCAKYKTEWRARLTIRFILPKISGIAGHWELTTGGVKSSIPEIITVFDRVLEEVGHIRGVIFDLNVAIHKSNKPNSKKRFPVITLVPNHSRENLEMIKNHIGIGVTKTDIQGQNLIG
jgi:hypothetical protein